VNCCNSHVFGSAPLSLQADKGTGATNRSDCSSAPRLESWISNKGGRTQILVQVVLTSALIYLDMVVDLPPWAIKEIDKIRRRHEAFFGKGGGSAWRCTTHVAPAPTPRPQTWRSWQVGISALQNLSWALRMRCLSLKKKNKPSSPWVEYWNSLSMCITVWGLSSLWWSSLKSVIEHVLCFGRIGDFMDNVLLILLHISTLSFLRGEPSWKISQTRLGSRMCKVCFQWVPLLNSLNYETSCLVWTYNLVLMILIFGNSTQVDSTRQSQLMKDFSREQWGWNLARGSGRCGTRLMLLLHLACCT